MFSEIQYCLVSTIIIIIVRIVKLRLWTIATVSSLKCGKTVEENRYNNNSHLLVYTVARR